MLTEKDALDQTLLERIKERPGASVRDIIKPLFLERSESALRARLSLLELRREIRLEKTKHQVRCFIEKNPEAEG